MKTINWLKPIDFDKVPVSVSMILTLLSLFALLFWPASNFLIAGLAVFGFLVFLILILRRDSGIYWLAALVFFNGFEISFSQYGWAQNWNFLSNLNAPLGDFVAILVFCFFILALVLGMRRLPSGWLNKFRRPIIFYGLFCLWGLLAVPFAYGRNYGESFHYWARFMVFSGVFLILPAWYIDKKEILLKVFNILFWAGVSIALFGLSSLFLVDFSSWARAVPYGIGSFAPLGDNHNIMAQALATIIPIGIFLVIYEKDQQAKRLKSAGLIAMILACFLTLSRAGWLCLIATGLIYGYYNRVLVKKWLVRRGGLILGGIALVFVGLYVLSFLGSGVVKSSNEARLEGARLSIFYALRSPIIGHGPGSYLLIARDSEVLNWEFGEPLEAHGTIQKILPETGFVGLILFGLFLWAVYRELFLWQKNISSAYSPLVPAILAMAVSAVLFQFFGTNYFSGVMFLPLGVALATARLFDKKV